MKKRSRRRRVEDQKKRGREEYDDESETSNANAETWYCGGGLRQLWTTVDNCGQHYY